MYISNFKLQLICRHLSQGGLICYPCEAVYGLGCDPLCEQAVGKLLAIKQRPEKKGLILIAADFQQIAPYLVTDAAMLERIMPTWPGPVTWAIPVQDWVPEWLTGTYNTLAVRITDHPLVKALCLAYNSPLVSTSANPVGQKPARNALQMRKYFPGIREILAVPGDTGKLKQTTPIYLATDGRRLR